MAGTLVITTLSDGTNSTSSTNCIQGSAKAWACWNGASPASIRGSYNVSSITYSSAGTYVVNFTTAFADTNYSFVSACAAESTGNWNMSICEGYAFNRTTTQVSIRVSKAHTTTPLDVPYVNISVNR
jgi:hypothetical protein